LATDSTRKRAIAGLVSVLAAVTAGSDYFYTLSGDQQVTATIDTDARRLEVPAAVTLRIRDGQENHVRDYVGRNDGSTVELLLMVDVLLKHTAGDAGNLVNELQDAIHDVVHAVAKNPTFTNVVNDAFVEQIDETFYDVDTSVAAATIRVRCTYDYQPGVTT
jgi:hypothetical protein